MYLHPPATSVAGGLLLVFSSHDILNTRDDALSAPPSGRIVLDCCHTVGVKSVCGAEVGGVTVIWTASKLLPVRDYAGRPMISAIIPGRLLHIRFQVQADNSEFDMLAAYMPAPSAGEARRAEMGAIAALRVRRAVVMICGAQRTA